MIRALPDSYRHKKARMHMHSGLFCVVEAASPNKNAIPLNGMAYLKRIKGGRSFSSSVRMKRAQKSIREIIERQEPRKNHIIWAGWKRIRRNVPNSSIRCKPAGSSFVFSPKVVIMPPGMGHGSGISRIPWRKCRRIRLEQSQSLRNSSAAPAPSSQVVKNAREWLQLVRVKTDGLLGAVATILQIPLPPQLELGEPNITSHWRSKVSLRPPSGTTGA